MQLEHKVAIITGGASGFGEATAKLFAKEGAKVAVVDYHLEAAKEVVNAIEEEGGEAIAIDADVSQEAQIKAFIQQTVDTFGQIDVLFNNAGIFQPGNVEECSVEAWDESFAVNVKAIFLASKYAIPYLKKTHGNIINTASAGGLIGFPDAVAYAASKGAVISLTRALAVDYAEAGIRANAIAPGTGVTGMTSAILEDPKMREGFLAPIPMKDFGRPEDIAYAALYLASEHARYVTGVTLPVDGGWTMS